MTWTVRNSGDMVGCLVFIEERIILSQIQALSLIVLKQLPPQSATLKRGREGFLDYI